MPGRSDKGQDRSGKREAKRPTPRQRDGRQFREGGKASKPKPRKPPAGREENRKR